MSPSDYADPLEYLFTILAGVSFVLLVVVSIYELRHRRPDESLLERWYRHSVMGWILIVATMAFAAAAGGR